MMKAASSAEPSLTGRCFAAAGARRRGLAAEAAEDDRDEGAVHRLAHDVGQDRAGRADQRAGDDQRRIAEREADAGGGPARIGVQHRDHDRHVGAADRDDQQHAERQRDDRRSARSRARCPTSRRPTMNTTSATPSTMLMMCRAGRMIGAPLMRPDSFSERDHRAGEGQRADGDAERHFDQALRMDVARACRCRRPRARRTRRPRPAPRPCRPASGTRRPVPASRSSAPGARSPRRCRRRSRRRG